MAVADLRSGPRPRRRSLPWVLVVLAAAVVTAAQDREAVGARAVPSLHLYLMEGFAGDRVVVAFDGREVLALDRVTTSALTDAAGTYEVPLPRDGRGTLTVSLPARGLSREIPVDSSAAGAHIAISVRESGLETHVSRRPLGAM